MKLKALLSGLDYHIVRGDEDREVTALIYDSRNVARDSVFVCIKGAVSDGHRFIKEAADQGAAAVIVENIPPEIPPGLTVVKTNDTRYALALMSSIFFGNPKDQLKVIGITGTKGKTTTTYMIKSILEAVGHKVGLIGTIETIIGDEILPAGNTTPESYTIHEYFSRMAKKGCDCVVMEVSSQGLMLHRTAGIDFDIAIFTNLGKDHIGKSEHGDFEDYKRCKAMLFQQCRLGIGNIDDPWFEDIFRGAACTVETFGQRKGATYRAVDLRHISRPGLLGMAYRVEGKENLDVAVDLPGEFSVYNSLTAIAVCSHFRVPKDKMLQAIKGAKVRGRIEMVPVSDRLTVMIDYAHNAMSLESLLLTLRDYHPRRLVTVFGCGGNRAKSRRYEMGEVSGRLSDVTIITSDNPRFEEPVDIIEDIITGIKKTSGDYISICDRKEAIKYAIKNGEEGDVIIVAGKGHETYQEIRGIKHDMDDRELIRQSLQEIENEQVCTDHR